MIFAMGYGETLVKKISMQPTSILCLNHVFLENKFKKKSF